MRHSFEERTCKWESSGWAGWARLLDGVAARRVVYLHGSFELIASRLAETWRHGSVVRSWLLDLCAAILKDNESLEGVAPVIDDSGAGRWTAAEAIELGVPAPVITTALMARFSSQGRSDHARKLIALMRAGFGGHPVHRKA